MQMLGQISMQFNTLLGHKVLFESLITTFEPGKKLVWEARHADGYTREGTLMGQYLA